MLATTYRRSLCSLKNTSSPSKFVVPVLFIPVQYSAAITIYFTLYIGYSSFKTVTGFVSAALIT